MAPAARGKQRRSVGQDQYAVKLESLILAKQADLELLTWEWLDYLGGSPEFTGDANADGTPRVIGLPDEHCHGRHIGSGHALSGPHTGLSPAPHKISDQASAWNNPRSGRT
jgi:hypothetical protein